MKIKNKINKTINQIQLKTDMFENYKKQINKMIEEGRKNAEETNKLCDDILTIIEWQTLEFGYTQYLNRIECKVYEIKKIVTGEDENNE